VAVLVATTHSSPTASSRSWTG